jgi:hypothetical protein
MLSFRRVEMAFLRRFTLSIPLSFRPVDNVFRSYKCFLFFIFDPFQINIQNI